MENNVAKYDIAFIGEKRLGKTSVLASMINSFDKLGSDFEINPADSATSDNLKKKLYELQNAFNSAKNGDGYYTDDDTSATPGIEKFSFTVRTKVGREKSSQHICDLTFNDIHGESFSGSKYGIPKDIQDKVSEIIDKSQIIVFAIDSVGLIERENIGFAAPDALLQIVSKAIKTVKERIILFVPIKCEKYSKENKLSQLSQLIENEYAVLINKFKALGNCNIAITPMLTMGNMVFDHFEKDENGNVVYFPNTHRAKAWYKVVGDFAPKYCEQPLLHMFFLIIKEFKNDMEKAIKSEKPSSSDSGIPNVMKYFAFVNGIWGLGALALYAIGKKIIANYKNKAFVETINENNSNIKVCKPKINGDGFKLIHDPLGMVNFND